MDKIAIEKQIQTTGEKTSMWLCTKSVYKHEEHSKLDNLSYKDLKIRNHLTSTENTINQAKILMLYRSRMAKYANNYEQTEGILDCKLCGNHPDQQEEIYECDYNKKRIVLNGSYRDIFQEKINTDSIQTLEKIYNLRENKLSWDSFSKNSQVHSLYFPSLGQTTDAAAKNGGHLLLL